MSNLAIDSQKIEYPLNEEAKFFNNLYGLPIKNILIGITYPFSNYRINRKASNKYCLFEYISEGEGRAFIDGKWQSFKKGDLIFFDKDDDQNFHSVKNKPLKKIWISFSSEYIEKMIEEFNVKTGIYNCNASDIFENILSISKKEIITPDLAYHLTNSINNIITKMFFYINNNLNNKNVELKNKLQNYVYKKASLDEIASDLGISKTTLIRNFKREFNTTPYDYLLKEKISVAKTLLKTTSMSVKEIAYSLCFSDEHYFSYYFQRICKTTPTKYKLMQAKNQDKQSLPL